MRNTGHWWAGATLVVGTLLVLPCVSAAGDAPQPNVNAAVKRGSSPALRDLPAFVPDATAPEEVREINPRNARLPAALLEADEPEGELDPAVQSMHFADNMPAPVVNFEGIGNVNGVLPPDTTGDVGPDHYVQWVNLSFAVFDKTGAVLAGPFNGNVLWTGFGGTCETSNDGDPIVLYDHISDRWVMSQFTGDNHQCIAVSKSGDPTGEWWLYDFLADANSGYFNDYPKFGVWPDGYYFSANMFGASFQGAMAAVFERDAMLNGDPAQMIWFFTPDLADSPSFSILPADLDGLNLPPAEAPNPFIMSVDDAWGYDFPYDTDALVVMEFAVDWDTPGNSTFGPTEVIDLTAAGLGFDSNMCGYSRNCIPQPDTAQGVDALSSRAMYRLQYRNFGTHHSLVASQTVDENGADHAGVRWYELRDEGMGWGVLQGSTFAPDDAHRWMGDAAMDASGNIAVGYSVSSSTVYPSIRWAGRLASDPVNSLAQGESEVYTGGGSQQNTSARWGDYSTMAVDPVDDCTFWYTQQYIESTGNAPWQTRVASFKFDSCTTGPAGTVEGTVVNSATMNPLEGALVEVGGFSTVTDTMGFYSITVPEDTYDVTASKFGFTALTATDIEVLDGLTVTQDFELTPVGPAGLDGYVTGEGFSWPLYAMVEISSAGETVAELYTDPQNGYFEVELPMSTPYDLVVTSLIESYLPATRSIVLDMGGQTESFVLEDDGTGPWNNCRWIDGIEEDFDGGSFPPTGWTTINNGGDCVWSDTATVGRSNLTPGSGVAATADSDRCGIGTTMDTDLVSPVMDLSGATEVSLEFAYSYNDIGSADFAAASVSADGGASWTNIVTWTSDVSGTLTSDVSGLLAGSANAVVRFTYFAPSWDWYYQVDNVVVTSDGGDASYECTQLLGSLVEGFVTDANSGDGLIGAEVSNDIGGSTTTVATPDDLMLPDGFYTLFTPLPLGDGPSTRTFTATANGYGAGEVAVNLTPNTVNALDFELKAGWLELTPDLLSARLYAGETGDQSLEVVNHGGIDADVMLMSVPVKVSWDYSAPEFDLGNLPGNTDTLSMGRAPSAGSPEAVNWNTDLVLNGAEAFGMDIFPGQTLVNWPDVTAPDTWNIISGGMESFYAGGDFLLGDFSTLYVIGYSTNNFATVDTATGAATVIAVANPGGGESWSGMTAAVYGTLYAASAVCGVNSTLHTIDPTTGAVSTIGSITNGTCIIDIAINAEGELFGIDLVTDTLLQIDPGTGAGTVIGSLGVDCNFAQGMDFDEVSGTLYWAAYTLQGELRVIDTSTGASSLVGAFPGGAEVDAFAIATSAGGGGLPWLELTPTDGTSPANGDLPINAEFIADGADHYGLYQARIMVGHDTPYDVNETWVCFTKAFNDVNEAFWGNEYIHSVAGARITGGCGLGNFCSGDLMLRHVMARWLLKLVHGPDYSPPPCQGVFEDVVCESTPNADWIEQLYAEGITTGCSADPLLFCPYDGVTRSQMAVFILRAIEGPDYVPPACTGVFGDVNCPNYWAADWIEELYARGITTGCSADPLLFCPADSTNRAQMSAFVQRAWELPMCADED